MLGQGLMLTSQLQKLNIQDSRIVPLLSFVRYRKRRWIPLAASKLFRVRVIERLEPTLHAELKQRNERYKTTMNAIRLYLRDDLEKKAALLTGQAQTDIEHDDLEACLRESETFNRRSVEFRESREAGEGKQVEEEQLAMMLKLEKKEQERLAAAREEVLKTINVSGQFIAKEGVQSSIEQALNTRQTYNFAIDTDGRRHVEQTDGSVIVKEREQEAKSS